MRLYLDTSAWVPLYLKEPRTATSSTAAVAQTRAAGRTMCASSLAYPETRAALAVARRNWRFRAAPYARALADFEEDWGIVMALDLDESLARVAGQLAEAHGLKGADGAHLATAVYLSSEPEGVVLLAFDAALEAAARAVGVAVWTP